MTAAADEDFGPPPESDDTLRCEDCGNGFEHAGRGRKPKRCPDCRSAPRQRAGSSGTGEDSAPKRPRGLDQLQRNIHASLGMLGMGLMLVDPFDAKVILNQAEEGAKVLTHWASTNPKIRAALERGVEFGGGLPVMLWAFKTALPIAAHHGLVRNVPDPAQPPPASNGLGNGAI